MITQLRKRMRLDNLRSEKRKRKGAFGRWIYLALLLTMAAWLFNLILGDLFFFRAEGFVLRTKQEAAAPFLAQVAELYVSEGESVEMGQALARLHSPEVTRDIAQLSIRIADLEIRMTELRARNKVLEGMLPFARKRSRKAREAVGQIDSERGKGLATSQRISAAAKEEFESVGELKRISAEYATLNAQLGQLESALERARQAYDTMTALYGNGRVLAAAPGTVATVPAAVGSVVREGEPIMELFTGPSFIMAYANPGSLYRIEEGEAVAATYGLRVLKGEIREILPISTNLPQEFQKAFRPKDRAQIIKIDIPEAEAPPLLTKVEVTSENSLRALALGLLQPLRNRP